MQAYYTAIGITCAVSFLLFVLLACFTRWRDYRYYGLSGFLFLLCLGAAGWVRVWQSHPAIDITHFSRTSAAALVGYIAEEPAIRGQQVRFPLTITHRYTADTLTASSGILMVTVDRRNSETDASFSYGDRLMVPATYATVEPPRNPGEMNYKRYLANQDMWHQAYLSVDEVRPLHGRGGNPLIARALALRSKMVAKFARHLSDSVALSVASTLILGYRVTLSQHVIDSFAATGTIHVLSVSGMHVVIIFWLLSQLLGWMGRGMRGRTIRFLLLLAAIWAYALLTGFSPAVLRASLMISIVLAANGFGLSHQIYNSIAASAFILLWYHPKFMVDIGFQLSYLAVLGMVFLLPKMQRTFPVRHRYGKPVLAYGWMSVSAQAGAGPLAAYYFHQFPLYFLPANLLIVLPVSAIMYLGFTLLLLPLGDFSTGIAYLLENLILLVCRMLNAIEQWPLAHISGIWVTWWESILIYLGIVAFTLAVARRNKYWLYSTLAGALLLGVSYSIQEYRKAYRHELVVFNVGRNMALGLIGPTDAWLYTSLPSIDHRTIQYSVMPKLEADVPVRRIHFLHQDHTYRGEQLYVRSNVIQFGEKRMMVYDATAAYSGCLEVDILLLRNNPRIGLSELRQHYTFRQLIIDGSNHDSTIERFVKAGKAMGVPVYVLKRNFAYVWATEAQLP